MKKEEIEYLKFRKSLVKIIEARRKELGLTQEDMDEGDWAIIVRTYQRIENQETDITLKNLFYIFKKLNMSFKDIDF